MLSRISYCSCICASAVFCKVGQGIAQTAGSRSSGSHVPHASLWHSLSPSFLIVLPTSCLSYPCIVLSCVTSAIPRQSRPIMILPRPPCRSHVCYVSQVGPRYAEALHHYRLLYIVGNVSCISHASIMAPRAAPSMPPIAFPHASTVISSSLCALFRHPPGVPILLPIHDACCLPFFFLLTLACSFHGCAHVSLCLDRTL